MMKIEKYGKKSLLLIFRDNIKRIFEKKAEVYIPMGVLIEVDDWGED